MKGDLGLVLNPIGIVHSSMKDVEDIPLPDRSAEVEIYEIGRAHV